MPVVGPAPIRPHQRGHGLAEYCLIAALIALAGLGLYVHLSGGVRDLWTTANSALVNGNSSAGPSTTSTSTSAH